MSGDGEKGGRNEARRQVAVTIPAELAERLDSFCREKNVAPDRVVERALIEYFREGDMSH